MMSTVAARARTAATTGAFLGAACKPPGAMGALRGVRGSPGPPHHRVNPSGVVWSSPPADRAITLTMALRTGPPGNFQAAHLLGASAGLHAQRLAGAHGGAHGRSLRGSDSLHLGRWRVCGGGRSLDQTASVHTRKPDTSWPSAPGSRFPRPVGAECLGWGALAVPCGGDGSRSLRSPPLCVASVPCPAATGRRHRHPCVCWPALGFPCQPTNPPCAAHPCVTARLAGAEAGGAGHSATWRRTWMGGHRRSGAVRKARQAA